LRSTPAAFSVRLTINIKTLKFFDVRNLVCKAINSVRKFSLLFKSSNDCENFFDQQQHSIAYFPHSALTEDTLVPDLSLKCS